MKRKIVNWFYFYAGILFLVLAKVKLALFKYTPKPISDADIERCIAHDIQIVTGWLACLRKYTNGDVSNALENKNVLELGPGSDLGIGLYILSMKAKNYFAIDVYDLASNVSDNFYNAFFSFLNKIKNVVVAPLAAELDKTRKGRSERLNFIVRKDFNIAEALAQYKIDFIFSNAAFEHFDDIYKTIENISSIASKGAVFLSEIDLRAHSRWIVDKDPNSIYRYPAWLYKLLSTRSTPNRMRPYQYEDALKKSGWSNIKIYPITVLNDSKFDFIKNHLNKKFKDPKNQMDCLTVFICATKTA